MTGTQVTFSMLAAFGVTFGVTEVTTGLDLKPLYAYGPLGVMCAWLMWKGDARLRSVEVNVSVSMKENANAMDRATKANMLMLVAIPEVSEAIKIQARQLAQEAEEAIKKREAK